MPLPSNTPNTSQSSEQEFFEKINQAREYKLQCVRTTYEQQCQEIIESFQVKIDEYKKSIEQGNIQFSKVARELYFIGMNLSFDKAEQDFKSKVQQLKEKTSSQLSIIHKKYDQEIILASDIFRETQTIYLKAKHTHENLISTAENKFQQDNKFLYDEYKELITPHKKEKEAIIEKALQTMHKKNDDAYHQLASSIGFPYLELGADLDAFKDNIKLMRVAKNQNCHPLLSIDEFFALTQNKLALSENALLTSVINSMENNVKQVQCAMKQILDNNILLSTIELTKLFDETKELAAHIKRIMAEYNKMLFQQNGLQQYALTDHDLLTVWVNSRYLTLNTLFIQVHMAEYDEVKIKCNEEYEKQIAPCKQDLFNKEKRLREDYYQKKQCLITEFEQQSDSACKKIQSTLSEMLQCPVAFTSKLIANLLNKSEPTPKASKQKTSEFTEALPTEDTNYVKHLNFFFLPHNITEQQHKLWQSRWPLTDDTTIIEPLISTMSNA